MLVLELAALSALALFPIWLLVRALNAGTWNQRGIDVSREERPIAFWFGIAMYAIIALIILSFPIYVGWDTLH